MHTRAWAVVRLVHPFPSALVTLASAVFIVVLNGGVPGWGLLLRALGTVVASQVAVGALNDYLDRDVDACTQPDKPLPSALVSPKVAVALVAIGIPCVVGFSATFGPTVCLVACIGTAGGLAYDLWLKPTPFSPIGYLVGFLSLFTFIRLVTGGFTSIFWLVYPAGAVLVVCAHLAQSFPDIESDRLAGNHGAAVLLGPTWTFRMIVISSLLVAAAGLGIAIAFGRIFAIACTAIAMVLIGASLLLNRSAETDMASRERLFYLVCSGLALTGAGSLLALSGS